MCGADGCRDIDRHCANNKINDDALAPRQRNVPSLHLYWTKLTRSVEPLLRQPDRIKANLNLTSNEQLRGREPSLSDPVDSLSLSITHPTS